MLSGADTQTDRHTYTYQHGNKQFQETKRVWPAAACAWFNNSTPLQNFYIPDKVTSTQ